MSLMKESKVENTTLEYLASSFNRYSLQSYIRAVASKGDLRVEFDSHSRSVDFSKKGKVVIPSIDGALNVDSITRILRIVDAAASTFRYGVNTRFLYDKGMTVRDSLLSIAVNALERDRCDFLSCKEFAGDAHILDGYYQLDDSFVPNIEKLAKKRDEQEDKDAQTAIDVVAALQILDAKLKSDYIVSADDMASKMKAVATKQAADIAEKLYKFIGDDHRKNCLNSKNPTEVSYELAKKIFQESTGESPEEEEQACQQQQKKQEKGETGPEGEEESSCYGSNSKGEEGEDDDTRPEVPPPMSEYKEGGDLGSDSLSSSGSGHGFTYGDFSEYEKASGFKVADEKDLIIIDFPRQKVQSRSQEKRYTDLYFKEDSYHNHYREEVDKLSSGRGLANSVRRLLEINTRSKYQYGKKSGKIHSANLYRVTMKDAQGFNERVFRRKEEKFNLDVAVSPLVDYSGSMSGLKLEHAIQAAYLLQDAVGRSLRVPVEVLGFTENSRNCSTLLIFKGFDDRVGPETLKGYMCSGGSNTCQNADGEAIAWAHNRIIKRKERRKIQIVFSDGSPACNRPGIVNYTGEVIKDIEDKSPVEIYGIGIMDGSVERFYKSNQVIQEPDELEPALLNLIKRSIIR